VQTDLDLWNLPLQRGGVLEIFDPVHAWPGAPSGPTGRIYVDVNRIPFGAYQTGYDPITQRCWMRYKAFDDSPWTAWRTFEGSLAPDAPLANTAYAVDSRNTIEVNFTVALDPTATPATTAFAVTGKTVTAVSVAPAGKSNVVRLSLNTPLAATGNFTVGYTQPAPPRLKSSDQVDVASFSNLSIVLPSVMVVAVAELSQPAPPLAPKPEPAPAPEPEPAPEPVPNPSTEEPSDG
jgi:hypothetical protein